MSEKIAGNLHEYSVSELSGAVKRTIEDSFGLVRVKGELGRVTRAASGHVYLDLKDEKAVISGVMWKGMAARLAINPEQGMEVVATGRMTTFPGQSRYQLIIDSLEPAGVGALMALGTKEKTRRRGTVRAGAKKAAAISARSDRCCDIAFRGGHSRHSPSPARAFSASGHCVADSGAGTRRGRENRRRHSRL